MRAAFVLGSVFGLLSALLPARAESVSLGTVFQGEETSFELPCANGGPQPIWVVDTNSSCDCLVGRFSPTQLAPGETVRLRFAYRSAVAGGFSVIVQVRGSKTSEIFGTYTVTGFVAEKSWLLPAAQLLGPGELQKAVIIDTRDSKAYARAHIPRSLNLPAFAIKTRRDLRERRLVLVDEGVAPDVLLDRAIGLRREGFTQLSILEGGLAEWVRRGGAMEGTDSSPLAVASLSAAEFVQSEAHCAWRVVEVKGNAAGMSSLYAAAKVDRWEDLEKALPSLSGHAAGRLAPRILVIAPDQTTSARIEARFGGKNPAPIYYLADGRPALEAYLKERAALASNLHATVQVRSGGGTPVVPGGCSTCPKRR